MKGFVFKHSRKQNPLVTWQPPTYANRLPAQRQVPSVLPDTSMPAPTVFGNAEGNTPTPPYNPAPSVPAPTSPSAADTAPSAEELAAKIEANTTYTPPFNPYPNGMPGSMPSWGGQTGGIKPPRGTSARRRVPPVG